MTTKQKEIGSLALYIQLAHEGSAEAVDRITAGLTLDMSFAQSRFIDYALGLVKSDEGAERIGWYLFNGTPNPAQLCHAVFQPPVRKRRLGQG